MDRGRAVWSDEGRIRFLEEPEVVQRRQLRVETRRDEEYWGGIARQRVGGEVYCSWEVGKVQPINGTERKLGYTVLGARVIVQGEPLN